MNISYNWLKELIDIELSADDTAEALTRVGLAVDEVHAFADDHVFDIDLTSNRPDCLSHLGVARELHVITGRELPAETQRREEEAAEAVPFPALLAPDVVKIEDAELCYRFTARIIRGVKIGPSPDWLIKRLEAIGERSINNVADITNYVMHELGQPMHAFDLNKLSENRIVVRRARDGETIATLDEVDRKLEDTMLVICDAEKPVAVAGVMGGIMSGITEATTDVLLEVAYFDRASIRQTSRKLNLATEASYRFERGVDINNLQRASDRAAALIVELAGGKCGDLIDVYPTRLTPAMVASQNISAAVKRLTGLNVATTECDRILHSLGISLKSDGEYLSPSWRHDIAIEEDLVEEVARHTGYHNIKDELPPAFHAGEYQETEIRERKLRDALAANGFNEALSYSFIDTRFDEIFEPIQLSASIGSDKYVTLKDSVIEGAVRMRPTLLPGLLDAVRLNFNHQRRDLRFFELGKAFFASPDGELPLERELFALAVTGGNAGEGRSLSTRELDFYDAKGSVESVFEALGHTEVKFLAKNIAHLQKGQAADIQINGTSVGNLGRLSEEIAAHYKFKQPIYVAEIDLEAVLAQETPAILYRALPKYPSVVRDVSFAVGRDTNFAEIRNAIRGQDAGLLQNVSFVDVYEGKGLEPGQRSLTLRLEYRSEERTLTEAEVDETHLSILSALEERLGIKPRI